MSDQVWVLKDFSTWLMEFRVKWEKAKPDGTVRYLTWEEQRFLDTKKSAYESVLLHTERFQKKEAFLWKQNGDLHREVVKLRQEIKFLKEM